MTRKLHIGGTVAAQGWEVFNAIPGPHVDHLGNASDLSRFENGTFDAIYASHILEHFDYKGELQAALAEWNRVLATKGIIYLSVPDLDTLCRIYLAKNQLVIDERFFIMRMMFGGHVDEYDYHMVGLNQEFLERFLTRAGFINVRRVDDLGLFDDTSRQRFKGIPISLNMLAEKPGV